MWVVCLVLTFIFPEALDGSKYKFGIIVLAYLSPLLVVITFSWDYLSENQKEDNNEGKN